MDAWIFHQKRFDLVMCVAAQSRAEALHYLLADDPCWHETDQVDIGTSEKSAEQVADGRCPRIVWSECPPGQNRMDAA